MEKKDVKENKIALILCAIAFFVTAVVSIAFNTKDPSIIYTLSGIISIIMCFGCIVRATYKPMDNDTI